MNQEAQKVAIPAFLRKRLQAFRVRQGKDQSYIVLDQIEGQTYKFEPWQFFILEVLPECDDFSKLASVFEDRFGHSITNKEVEELFSLVADKKLFGLSAISHPMLAAFNKRRATRLGGEAPGASFQGIAAGSNSSAKEASHEPQGTSSAAKSAESNSKTESNRPLNIDEEPLPAGVRDAIGLDDTMRKKGWKLFNPTRLIKLIQPLLLPLKHTIYLLPILLIAALFISARHALLIEEDLIRLRDSKSFIEHALLSMVTVNLLVTLVTAIVAYTYRATVSGFCIVFIMGFFPRFMVRIGHVRQLLRRERIWLHAAPLLLRLGLFSFGILMWFNTRTMDGFLPSLGLVIAAVCAISFFITVNPLVKSSGYNLLAAFLNEPRLRGKAYMALFNKFRGNVYKKADNNVLAAYALASILFMVVIFAVVLLLFGRFLKIHLGGAGVLLIVFISLTLLLRMITKFKKIEQLYERSVQFERWRDRTLPKVENDIVTKESQNVLMTYLRRALFFLFLVVLFVPYNYEPGGNFVILPNKQQEITTELSGIIDEIYFDGGETLKKGTVIGRLSYSDCLAQVNIYTAKMQEQQAVINELKSRPRPEEVHLAERALEVEKTRARFSKAKVSRLEKLYEEKTISFEDLDDARREYEVDLEQIEEKRANLEFIKSGAPPDKIASAEAKLQSLKEERDYNQQKIELSVFYMPFDGKLIAMHLKQKIGSYFNKGETLAVAENTDQVDVQIEVPESDISYVVESARIRARPLTYHSEDFTGVVTAIDAEVTETRSGKVVRVITSVENKDGRLKAGMTGYAKVSCGTLPVWKILSLDIVRFVKVEGWSWLP